MEKIIDNFETVSGWVSDPVFIKITDNGFEEHILNGNSSMRIIVEEGSNGKTLKKVFSTPVNLVGYNNLRFFISKYNNRVNEEFSLKFSIGNTAGSVYVALEEWFVPVTGKQNLALVNVEVKNISTFNTILFTVIGNNSEVWWMDYLIACNDEFVIDSLSAVRAKMDCILEYPLGLSPQILFKGEGGMILPDWVNVTKYSLIKIKEGALEEKHIVAGEVSNGKIEFMDETYFDGSVLKHDYTSAAVLSLVIPALMVGRDMQMVVPGIYISGFIPVTPPDGSVNSIFDSYKTSGERRSIGFRRDLKLPVEIEVQSVQMELMVNINNFVQGLFSDGGTVLVNGVCCDVIMEDTPKFDAGDVEGSIPYSSHFYSVNILDILNEKVSYIRIPSEYIYNFNVNSRVAEV